MLKWFTIQWVRLASAAIRVVADPHMIIRETSESDNEAVTSLMVQPPALPNLVISGNNIGFSDDKPDMGAVVTVTATILNNGQR